MDKKLKEKTSRISYICQVCANGDVTSWNDTGVTIWTMTKTNSIQCKKKLRHYGIFSHLVDIKIEEGRNWDSENGRWRLDIEYDEVKDEIEFQ